MFIAAATTRSELRTSSPACSIRKFKGLILFGFMQHQPMGDFPEDFLKFETRTFEDTSALSKITPNLDNWKRTWRCCSHQRKIRSVRVSHRMVCDSMTSFPACSRNVLPLQFDLQIRRKQYSVLCGYYYVMVRRQHESRITETKLI